MSDRPPDPNRRAIFDLFRDPQRLGREVGRYLRLAREAIDPPMFTEEEFQALQATVERLESQMTALQEQTEQDQEALLALVRNAAATDEKLTQILDALEKSASPRDQQDLPRWVALRARLRQAVKALLAFFALALGESWVQDQLYPLVKSLPARTHDVWLDLLRQSSVEAGAPPSPLSTPEPAAPRVTESPDHPSQQPTKRGRRRWTGSRSPIDFDWVTIPAGVFLMGSDKRKEPDTWNRELPQHRLYLPRYRIARIPVTNVQYKAFVDATGHAAPDHWKGGKIPTGKEQHPVVYVNWYDAMAFCKWANVRLPSEAEWEKAARGTDGRIYPWGNNEPDERLCNFNVNVRETTPVDRYPAGASPYGVLDMSGNVWEWTSSLYRSYPYDADDGREDPGADAPRVLRGGAFLHDRRLVRCAYRNNFYPSPRARGSFIGFRVVSPGLEPLAL